MKLSDFDFTNGNNACQSLRFLAEMARIGDVQVSEHLTPGGILRLTVTDKSSRTTLPMVNADQGGILVQRTCGHLSLVDLSSILAADVSPEGRLRGVCAECLSGQRP